MSNIRIRSQKKRNLIENEDPNKDKKYFLHSENLLLILGEQKIATSETLSSSKIPDNAFTTGEIPVLIKESKYKEMVCIWVPAQKKDKTKSSKDRIKIKSPTAIMLILREGKVILKNEVISDAPRFMEASFNLGSISLYLINNTGIANPRPSTV